MKKLLSILCLAISALPAMSATFFFEQINPLAVGVQRERFVVEARITNLTDQTQNVPIGFSTGPGGTYGISTGWSDGPYHLLYPLTLGPNEVYEGPLWDCFVSPHVGLGYKSMFCRVGFENTFEVSVDIHPAVVPEPASMSALGLGALTLLRRKRSSRSR